LLPDLRRRLLRRQQPRCPAHPFTRPAQTNRPQPRARRLHPHPLRSKSSRPGRRPAPTRVTALPPLFLASPPLAPVPGHRLGHSPPPHTKHGPPARAGFAPKPSACVEVWREAAGRAGVCMFLAPALLKGGHALVAVCDEAGTLAVCSDV